MPVPRSRWLPIEQLADLSLFDPTDDVADDGDTLDPDPFGIADLEPLPVARDGMVRHTLAYRYVKVGPTFIPVAHPVVTSLVPVGTPPPQTPHVSQSCPPNNTNTK